MALQHELGLRKSFSVLEHEAILSIYYTASLIKKSADEFFRGLGLTDVQFNVLMLLSHQCGPDEGLSQAQLSKMMLVNRANVTSLIDRMEKADLVVRTPANDRRFNIIKMTDQGRKKFAQAEPLYAAMIKNMMAEIDRSDQHKLIAVLENIRSGLGV